MELDSRTAMPSPHRIGQDELHKRWGQFLALGVFLIVLGSVALVYSVVATLVTVEFLGWLLIIGGVFQTLHAFFCKAWGGFFIDLLTGILYTVFGFMIVANPNTTALALTLLIAVFLLFSGIFRLVVALGVWFQHSMWMFLSGVINLLLGVLIWQEWPVSGLWVIGLFVGIEMLFNGWSLIMLGLVAKKLVPRGALV